MHFSIYLPSTHRFCANVSNKIETTSHWKHIEKHCISAHTTNNKNKMNACWSEIRNQQPWTWLTPSNLVNPNDYSEIAWMVKPNDASQIVWMLKLKQERQYPVQDPIFHACNSCSSNATM